MENGRTNHLIRMQIVAVTNDILQLNIAVAAANPPPSDYWHGCTKRSEERWAWRNFVCFLRSNNRKVKDRRSTIKSQVLVDGHEVRSLNLQWLRQHIGIVQQVGLWSFVFASVTACTSYAWEEFTRYHGCVWSLIFFWNRFSSMTRSRTISGSATRTCPRRRWSACVGWPTRTISCRDSRKYGVAWEWSPCQNSTGRRFLIYRNRRATTRILAMVECNCRADRSSGSRLRGR